MTVAAVAAVGVSALPASGAESSSRLDELRRADAALAARSRAAVLELYALEADVRGARARLAAVRERSEALARERASVAARVGIARRSFVAAQAGLALRLRALYEQGGTDPLSIILAAESIEDALATIDGLGFAARQDRTLVARTRAARAALDRLRVRLSARAAALAESEREAAAEAAALASREAERRAYVSTLARERSLNAGQIAAIERQVAAAEARSDALTARAGAPAGSGTAVVDADSGPTRAAAPAPAAAATPTAPPAASASSGTTLVVSATAYALRGRTASGLPTSWGVAAVDPRVIPLGTRFFVPGYGEAIAADVGSAVNGNEIDLWFPSLAQARAWGRRTVTIVIH